MINSYTAFINQQFDSLYDPFLGFFFTSKYLLACRGSQGFPGCVTASRDSKLVLRSGDVGVKKPGNGRDERTFHARILLNLAMEKLFV